MLLLGWPLVLVWQPVDIVPALLVFGFAVAEFVNYFLFRLSYPVRDFVERLPQLRFPPSLLAQELRRSLKQAARA